MRSALLVDDSPLVRAVLQAVLEQGGYAVSNAASVREARISLASGRFDTVLLDLHLPDGLGPSILAEVRTLQPTAVVAIVTGSGGAGGIPADVDLVVDKGVAPMELLGRLEEAGRRRK